MMKTLLITPSIALFLLLSPLVEQAQSAPDFTALATDSAAIERVYYAHRTGMKPFSEDAISTSQIKEWVQANAHAEVVLKRVYGLEVTPASVKAEVQRIQARLAPETLAEIQRALGNDPERFAQSMARPLVVERLLRECFDRDEKLHAPQRQAMEALRLKLLTTPSENSPAKAQLAQENEPFDAESAPFMDEITWVLPQPTPERVPSGKPAPRNDLVKVTAKVGASGTGVIEPTAKAFASSAKSAPARAEQRRYYFKDLPEALQNDLRTQLRQSGDVSEVIETPRSFTLYLVREKTATQLSVAVFTLPKRSYEEWLAEQ